MTVAVCRPSTPSMKIGRSRSSGPKPWRRRIEFRRRRPHFNAERIEHRRQVAARAVGADHHQGAHAVARRRLHILRWRRPADASRAFCSSLVGEARPNCRRADAVVRWFAAAPVRRDTRTGPRTAARTAMGSSRSCWKNVRQDGSTELGSFRNLRVHLLHERRVGAVEKARFEHRRVGQAAGVVRHGNADLSEESRAYPWNIGRRRQAAPLLKCVG